MQIYQGATNVYYDNLGKLRPMESLDMQCRTIGQLTYKHNCFVPYNRISWDKNLYMNKCEI